MSGPQQQNQDKEVQEILEELRNAKTTLQATITELEAQLSNLGQLEYRMRRHLSHQARIDDILR